MHYVKHHYAVSEQSLAFDNAATQNYVHLFFIRTILEEHEAHFCSKFKNNPASAEVQSFKFSVKV